MNFIILRDGTKLSFQYDGRRYRTVGHDSGCLAGNMAASLSRIPRFTGHTRVGISVAEHSIGVARLLQLHGSDVETQFLGLIHEAGEMVTGDIPTPVKNINPGIREFERDIYIDLERELCPFGHFRPASRELVKQADLLALHAEAQRFMAGFSLDAYGGEPSFLSEWGLQEDYLRKLEILYHGKDGGEMHHPGHTDWSEAQRFLNWYGVLMGRLLLEARERGACSRNLVTADWAARNTGVVWALTSFTKRGKLA